MTTAWTLEIDADRIAWLTFDRPGEKVNTFTASTMNELSAMLERVTTDDSIKALVIRSGKPDGFIAGADIKELVQLSSPEDAVAKAQSGQAVFDRIALMPIPSIALIHGACMGGGMEMALACDYRLVTDDPATTMAQPEIKLGILPGWGGTQRLPRLIGLPRALDLILSGRTIPGRTACRWGLADGTIAMAFATEQAQQFVLRIASVRGRRAVHRRRRRGRPLMLRMLELVAPGRAVILSRAHKGVLAKTHGNYPAPLEVLDLVRATYRRVGLSRGLGLEAEAFGRLACTPVARNLLWLFQASRRQKKAGSGEGAAPVSRAGVVGAGVMGGGICWALSQAGITVRLQDISWPAAASGMRAAAGMYRELVKRRKMTEGGMNLAMHRIGPTIDYTGFADADIVIEAVVEDLDIKRAVLREIERRVRPDTIICTNTSSLALADLASSLEHPGRFLGLHFFNPVNRMPLVEVVPGPKTSPKAVVAAADLVRRIGKTPIVVGDCAGFLVNRILLPYLIESTWMFEEGVDAERLDHVLEMFGMPMGPLALADEVGLDVGYKVAKVLEGAYGERMKVASALDRVVKAGQLTGRKGGRGIYLYDNGHRKVNPDVAPLLLAAREQDGVEVRDLSDEDIVDRAVLIMVNEAARCLEEGIVEAPESLDMAMVMGTGFAPFRGGLLRYADDRGLAAIRDRLEQLADAYGERFRPAPLIEQLANRSGRFHAALKAANGTETSS